HGESLNVREHQFIAATDAIDYSFERVQGVRNMLLGGSGFFIDNFRAANGDAIVWVHGHGNVFEVTLDQGEQLDVEAGGWLYKDTTVRMEAVGMGLKTGLLGGGGKLTWNRFTGPGRLAIQTMFVAPLEGVEGQAGAAAEGGVVGAVLGGLLRG
ncbi:MAG TPA: AIM24 family protein, partial [Gaiellaceae bacterium]|nr:AIM24 family protein [Gaiellaceae bacterium]